jgi:hypothetical protein
MFSANNRQDAANASTACHRHSHLRRSRIAKHVAMVHNTGTRSSKESIMTRSK